MITLDTTSTAALALSLLLLLSALWRQRRTPTATRAVADEALDTVADWPPQVVRILSLPERQAYNVLRKAMPGHLVLAQVPLSRFISVPTQRPYSQWLQRVGRLTVDLVVCDHSSRAIAVIEIRGAEETARSRRRHQRVAEVLRQAGVAVHVWPEGALPAPSEVRKLFLVDQVPDDGLTVDTTGRRVLPVAEMQELLAAGDDADYQQEPVPSTFFDDFDPLAARAAA